MYERGFSKVKHTYQAHTLSTHLLLLLLWYCHYLLLLWFSKDAHTLSIPSAHTQHKLSTLRTGKTKKKRRKRDKSTYTKHTLKHRPGGSKALSAKSGTWIFSC